MTHQKPEIEITFSEIKQSPEEQRKTLVRALSILFSAPLEIKPLAKVN